MGKTNAERQRTWYARHRRETFGRAHSPLTMRRIYNYLLKHPEDPFKRTASAVYRALSAHRDKADWRWLIGEIYHNQCAGDKEAPVTCRGDGKSTNAMFLEISSEWDTTRDWDKEQEPGYQPHTMPDSMPSTPFKDPEAF